MLDYEIIAYMKAMADKFGGEDGCEKIWLNAHEWMYVEDVCQAVCDYIEDRRKE